MSSPPVRNEFRTATAAEWLPGGAPYFARLRHLIGEAENSIAVFVYILTPDSTGRTFMADLIRATRRGVKVELLIDDYGSSEFTHDHEDELTVAGITVKRFEPLFSSVNFYVGRRMHAKVVIVDERKALVGGINIADRYHGTNSEAAWLDYGIFIEGESVAQLRRWGNKLIKPFDNLGVPKIRLKPTPKNYPDPNGLWTRTAVNDFIGNRRDITRNYYNAIRNASSSICIVGGYFIPGRRIRNALRQAAKSNIDIRIIVTQSSDVPITRLASEFLIISLMRSGVKFYEYGAAMVHGKAAVVDDEWLTIGSYNMNPLSAYFSIEVNVDVVNKELATSFHAHLNELMQHQCVELDAETFSNSGGWWMKFKRWYSYHIVRLSLRLLFWANHINEDED